VAISIDELKFRDLTIAAIKNCVNLEELKVIGNPNCKKGLKSKTFHLFLDALGSLANLQKLSLQLSIEKTATDFTSDWSNVIGQTKLRFFEFQSQPKQDEKFLAEALEAFQESPHLKEIVLTFSSEDGSEETRPRLFERLTSLLKKKEGLSKVVYHGSDILVEAVAVPFLKALQKHSPTLK